MRQFVLFLLWLCSARYAHPSSNTGDVPRQHLDNKNGSCPQFALEEDRQTPGRSLLQSKQHLDVKTSSTGSSLYPSMNLQHDSGQSIGRARSRRYAALERQVQHVEKEGIAVVIPGLGDAIRALQVEKNLQWLKNQNVPFECWIFVYRTEEEFPLDASRFEPCHLTRHPGFWMNHILAMPLNMTRKPWIVHMMDGIEPQQDVNLKLLLRTMTANGLGRASPTFDLQMNPNSYPEGNYPIMARQGDVRIGRVVDFIELHFDVFSREYFACLQDNIDIDNALGWGMDRLLPKFCGGAIGGPGRIGLMDQMTMVKKFHGSYDYEAAFKGMVAFIGKHPEAPGPQFIALGELESPEVFEIAAAKAKAAEEAAAKERAAEEAAAEKKIAEFAAALKAAGEAVAKKAADEAAAKKKAEDEAAMARGRKQAAAAKKAAQEASARKIAEAAAAKKKADEEAAAEKMAADKVAAEKKASEEATAKEEAAKEAAAKKKKKEKIEYEAAAARAAAQKVAEEATAKKNVEEEAAKKKAEEEAAAEKRAAGEAAAEKKASEEATAKKEAAKEAAAKDKKEKMEYEVAAAQAAAQKVAEEAAAKKAVEEASAKKKAEEEAAAEKRAADEAAAEKKASEEAAADKIAAQFVARLAAEEAAANKKADEESAAAKVAAKKAAEEAVAEAAAKKKDEEEAASEKKAAEDIATKKAAARKVAEESAAEEAAEEAAAENLKHAAEERRRLRPLHRHQRRHLASPKNPPTEQVQTTVHFEVKNSTGE